MEKMNFVRTLTHDDLTEIINGVISTYVGDAITYKPTTDDLTKVDDVVNNFPAEFDSIDFITAVGSLSKETSCDNRGLWWEVLDTTLAMRASAPQLQVMAFDFTCELTFDEVSEIASDVMKEGLMAEALIMGEEEFNDFVEEELADYDEEEDIEADEMFAAVMEEVNSFPAIATAKDFAERIDRLCKMINNPPLWYEVIENCLAKRVGRSGNCLA